MSDRSYGIVERGGGPSPKAWPAGDPPRTNVSSEPIAVVGLACRFPGGADTPEAFWTLLEQGKRACVQAPAGRWSRGSQPSSLGPSPPLPRPAGFLDDDLSAWDPDCFGIDAQTAAGMDPRDRLLLEVAWEACENAGLHRMDLQGSGSGVFIGMTSRDRHAPSSPAFGSHDSGRLRPANPSAGSEWISAFFGLEGPSLTVDTDASSSLVAVHLACQSLRLGESPVAIAGGASLLLTPEETLPPTPTNRERGDQTADAPFRGEGCALLVLQPYADALAQGRPVLALIAGGAIHHAGRPTDRQEPDERIQQSLLRDALRKSGLAPAAVAYVEVHGAGGWSADSPEIRSLAAAYRGEPGPAAPLWIGSVKANLGHAAAAGAAGLLKTVLQLRHRTICPQVQAVPAPASTGWRTLPIQIAPRAARWPGESVGGAAVTAFGATGVHAHVLLREAPATPVPSASDTLRPVHLLVFSARNPAALRALADGWAPLLDPKDPQAERTANDLCFTAARARSAWEHRVAVLGKSAGELKTRLDQWRTGQSVAGVWRSTDAPASPSGLAFLFTGQGSQYRQMGRELWEHQPAFQAALRQCDTLLKPHLQLSLIDLIYNPSVPEEQLHQTVHTQPVIFAFGYALAKMWESWGVTPSVVLGHSIGEVAAACFAGVIPLEDALSLVALRGRLIQRATSPGTMGAIVAPAERVAAALRELGGEVEIAAVNAPENVVVSGPTPAVKRVLDYFRDRDIPSLALRISHAIHSPLMEPILEEYTAAAARIRFSRPRVPILSNLTGRLAGEEITRPDYWRQQLRQTVQFQACLETLREMRCPIALETGATSILSSLGAQTLPNADVLWLHSLGPKNSLFNMRPQRVPGRSDWETLLETVGQLYVRGLELRWDEIARGYAWRRMRLPNYPFQRQALRLA